MHKLGLIIFLSLTVSIARAQNDYISNGSIGVVKAQPTTAPKGDFSNGPVNFQDIELTIGQTYIVLPLTYSSEELGYLCLTKKDDRYKQPMSKDITGKQLKLTKMEYFKDRAYFTDTAGVEYVSRMISHRIPDMTLVSDIDDARKLFLNKTLWMNADFVFTGNPAGGSDVGSIKNIRFSPVTVVDVKAGYSNDAPILFIIKTTKGELGYVKTLVSGTNSLLDNQVMFKNFFYTEDPIKRYKFSPAVLSLVKSKTVKMGMPTDAVKLIYGTPDRVNVTKTAKAVREQWVYGNRYYYFDNGKLVTIN